jgi:transcriptional regulator with XRE-family HTH domain
MSEIKIGSVIKRLLRDQRRTLKEVSRQTQIPYSTLHTWQENRQPKDILKAQRLADYFGITLHHLLFDQEDFHEKRSSTQTELKNTEPFTGAFEIFVRRIE